jgi:hypothetical protein
MKRKFVELLGFRKCIDSLDLDQTALVSIQSDLLKNPEVGAIMTGTGGLRKFRLGLENRGKSGGLRVLYIDFPEIHQTWLVTAFPKSAKANLTKKERNEIAELIRAIKKELGI